MARRLFGMGIAEGFPAWDRTREPDAAGTDSEGRRTAPGRRARCADKEAWAIVNSFLINIGIEYWGRHARGWRQVC